MSFYHNVVDYCQRNGISIHAFEQMCSLGNGTVSAKKQGGQPSMSTLLRVEKYTKIPIAKWIE